MYTPIPWMPIIDLYWESIIHKGDAKETATTNMSFVFFDKIKDASVSVTVRLVPKKKCVEKYILK